MCSEQKVDFVQEVGALELITNKGVSFTQQISSLVLICAAKTRSHKKKKEKDMQGVCDCFGHWTVFMC